jgi:hypothetical protein
MIGRLIAAAWGKEMNRLRRFYEKLPAKIASETEDELACLPTVLIPVNQSNSDHV